MRYESVTVDGSQVLELVGNAEGFKAVSDELFDDLDDNHNGILERDEYLPSLMALALSLELGMPRRQHEEIEHMLTDAFNHLDFESYAAYGQVHKQEFVEINRRALTEVAERLQNSPVTIEFAEFDGQILRDLLAGCEEGDEEAQAKVAELSRRTFEAYKSEGATALTKDQLKTFLHRTVGDELGLPPLSPQHGATKASHAMYDKTFSKVFDVADSDHSGGIDEEEFHKLMFSVLESVAEEMKARPVVVTRRTEAHRAS